MRRQERPRAIARGVGSRAQGAAGRGRGGRRQQQAPEDAQQFCASGVAGGGGREVVPRLHIVQGEPRFGRRALTFSARFGRRPESIHVCGHKGQEGHHDAARQRVQAPSGQADQIDGEAAVWRLDCCGRFALRGGAATLGDAWRQPLHDRAAGLLVLGGRARAGALFFAGGWLCQLLWLAAFWRVRRRRDAQARHRAAQIRLPFGIGDDPLGRERGRAVGGGRGARAVADEQGRVVSPQDLAKAHEYRAAAARGRRQARAHQPSWRLVEVTKVAPINVSSRVPILSIQSRGIGKGGVIRLR